MATGDSPSRRICPDGGGLATSSAGGGRGAVLADAERWHHPGLSLQIWLD